MRAGWFKIGAVAAALVLVVAGYLVGRSGSGDGGGSAGPPAVGERGPGGDVETVREALTAPREATRLRTVRCPTQSSVGGSYVRPPATVRVRVPSRSGSPLVAYAAATGTLLPAPGGWECTASMGADGSEEIGAGPIGSVRMKRGIAQLRRHGPAVRATLIPACAGCIASAICSFFPEAAVAKLYERSEPCAGRPEGELRLRLSRSVYAFLDPPGVRGSAAGSGGSLPALGVLSYSWATGVRQLSCAAAASELGTCTDAVAAFLDLGPRP